MLQNGNKELSKVRIYQRGSHKP